MVNVLLVEDSRVTRDMVERHIDQSDEYRLIGTLENAANAEIVCTRGKVDLVLMDVCTADDESGLEAAARIKKRNPGIRIIIMTSMPEHSFIEKAKAAGCDSFWYKEYGDVELDEVMSRTIAGESVYPDETPMLIIGDAVSTEFTEREYAVLRQLAHGYKYDEIAQNMGISTNTVKFHIKGLLSKTGYHSTLQLVVDVVNKNLVLPGY